MPDEYVEKVGPIAILRAWIPPSIQILICLTIVVGIISWTRGWPSIPFNFALAGTVLCGIALHSERENRARRRQLSVEVYAAAYYDIERRYRQD